MGELPDGAKPNPRKHKKIDQALREAAQRFVQSVHSQHRFWLLSSYCGKDAEYPGF
jgi:hypothetical protein